MSAAKLGNWKKITPADAAEIALRAGAGESVSALAREYGIAPQTADYHAKNGKLTRDGFVDALREAAEYRRKGNLPAAVGALRAAADVLMVRAIVEAGA